MKQSISTLFPPDIAAALVVASTWPRDQREQRIDHLTDELVRRGLCRPRKAQGEFLPRGGWDDVVVEGSE